MIDFASSLRLAGLMPREIVGDGKWRRCPTEDHPRKRNGAYVLYPDGRGYWRNWALDDGVNSWRETDPAYVRRSDPAEVERRRAAEKEHRLASIRSARAVWAAAIPCRALHPYLAGKGLSPVGTVGLREHMGALVVPVFWRGKLISIQKIGADGTKRFAPGAPVKAGSYVIDRSHAAVTVICEGLATGLAVFQCVRNARVIVAFDAGNLLPAVQELKPTGSVVFAGDTAHGTQARRGFNPGLEKARNAAELIGAGVAYPEGIEGTDWADALAEFGPTGVKRIERLILSQVRYVMGAPM